MHKKNRIYFFILLLPLFFSACKKENDEYGPVVTFSGPAENQSFNVNDVFTVKASLQDDTRITSVSVGLVDADYNSVHTDIPVPVSSPSMDVNTSYALNNIHLESGYYYIRIFASDGKNDSRAYRRIYITAIPRTVQQVCLISAPNTLQTNLSYIDPSFSSLSPIYSFSGDYIGSAVSSYHQLAFVAGNVSGDLNALQLEDLSVQYSITHPSTLNPYYTGFYADEQNTYVAMYDGYVRGYDRNGSLVYSATANPGHYPIRFCFAGGRLIAEQKAKAGGAKILVSFYPGGSPQQQVSLSQDAVALCERDPDNVFVFGNSGGQAVIQLYDRLYNNLWDPYPGALPAGPLLSAVRIDPNTYLLGHSNGTIYKYEYSGSSLTTWLSGYTAIGLKYEPVQNEVYVVEGNALSTFGYPGAIPHNTMPSAENIRDAHVLYNR